jgi:antitoxin component YwqK of YwqJK toxin-antitoxin module
VTVTLEIPDDAITNMGRKSVVFRETARYRANKAKVLKIEDKAGRPYSRAKSFIYYTQSLDYIVNETILVEDYDMNLEKVYSSGIHYFLSRRCAAFCELYTIHNGLYQQWYGNGQKASECTYVSGQRNGLHQEWYENGQKREEGTYVNGQLDGLYQRWYENGQMREEGTYVNGKENGLNQSWHDNGHCRYTRNTPIRYDRHRHANGRLQSEIPYAGYDRRDPEHGIARTWFKNGQLESEKEYKWGALHGTTRRWYMNGKRAEETEYANGLNLGWSILYHVDGSVISSRYYIMGDVWDEIDEEYSRGPVEFDFQERAKQRTAILKDELLSASSFLQELYAL